LTITSDQLVIAAPHWNALQDKAVQMVQAYHKNFPLRRGIPREELKSRLKLQPRVFNALVRKLAAENAIVEAGNALASAGHEITFDNGQQAKVQGLMRRFAGNPYSPPSVKECQAEVGEEVVNALVELGQLKQLTPDVIFRIEDYEQMVSKVRNFISEKGQMTVADARDLFDSSRKYMLALMEHLDATGVTIRDGDFRKLRR
jgi:selenocysteine-specific elongation factor